MKSLRAFLSSIILICVGFGFGLGATSWYVIHKGSNPVELGHEGEIVSAFHRLYHNNWWERTVMNTHWMGVQTMQTPLDMWVIQEIIHETRPDVLIETGTAVGGSALFFASMFELEQHGRVISIDIVDLPGKPKHDRIRYLVGSSTSNEIVSDVSSLIGRDERVMVFLDSAHNKEHVLNELSIYAPMVCKGCYLIVSDTHLNGHPIFNSVSPGPGPMEALDEWLPHHPEFTCDVSREKYGLTFNPGGYLRRGKR